MFCSNCGKEINENSRFCSSCGYKIDNVKSNENIETDSNVPISQETKKVSPIPNDNPASESKTETIKHKRYGWGWIIVLLVYVSSVSSFLQKCRFVDGAYEFASYITFLLGLIAIFPLYFWVRNHLIEKGSMKGHVEISSFVSGAIFCVLIPSLVIGAITLLGIYEEREIKIILNEYVKKPKTPSKESWVFYGKSIYGDYYYDNNSILSVNQDIFRIWILERQSIEGKKFKTYVRKSLKLSTDGYDKLDQSIMLVQIYCQTNSMTTVKIVDYDNKGNILDDVDIPNPTITSISSNSINELIRKLICEKM